MEANDSESRVRPIAIEDDDGVRLPDAGRPSRRSTKRHHRPWMPLAVSGIAVAGLVVAVTFLGAIEFQDPPATNPGLFSLTTITDPDTGPIDTRSPTLEEAIPGVDKRLTLVTTDGDALWTLVWDPSFRVPKTSAVMTPGETAWSSAAFDAGGRVVAATGAHPNNPLPQDVWLGPPAQIDHMPDVEAIWSIAWHATELSRLAFVTLTIDDGSNSLFQLWTTTIDTLANSPSEPVLIVEMAEPPEIVRWDTAGFVLQVGKRTHVVGPRGEELWRADGWAHAASPNLIAQVRPTGLGSMWFLVDRESGEATSFAEFGIEARPEYTSIVASSTSDLFAAATYRDDRPVITRTSITVISPDLGAPRIVQVDRHVFPSQFTSDASFLILTESDTNDLVFVNWRTGATHVFDVPNDQRVLGLWLG